MLQIFYFSLNSKSLIADIHWFYHTYQINQPDKYGKIMLKLGNLKARYKFCVPAFTSMDFYGST